MKIKELINEMEYEILAGSEETEITTLVYDSRKVEKGSVFVCISGSVRDAHEFIPDVAAKGAAAIVVEKDVTPIDGITYIKVEDSRLALACMSAAYFGHPAKKIKDDRYYRNKRKNNDNLYGSFDSRVCGDQNRTDRHDRIDCWF